MRRLRDFAREDPITLAIKLAYAHLREGLEKAEKRARRLGLEDRVEDAWRVLERIPSAPLVGPPSGDAELVRRAFVYLASRADKLIEVGPRSEGPLRLFAEALMTTTFYSDLIASMVGKVPRGSAVLEVQAGPGVGSQVALTRSGASGVAADQDPTSLEIIEERALRLNLDLRPVLASYNDAPTYVGAPIGVFMAVSPTAWLVDIASLASRAHAALEPGGVFVAIWPVRHREPNPVEPFLRLMGIKRLPEWDELLYQVVHLVGFRRVRTKRIGPFTAIRAQKP